MKKIVLVLASTLLLPMGSLQAAESIRWDTASLSYQSSDVDGDKLTGFGVSGTKLISEDFFIVGSYSSVSDDIDVFGSKVDIDFNTLYLGLGYRYAISNDTNLFGIVSYQDVEIDASFQGDSEDDSENGYGLQVGMRSLVTENIELSGSLSYAEIADVSETGFDLSAMYHFTEQFSAGAGYGKSDDIDSLSLSAVLFF